jgi:hypothetical protein
VSRALYIERVSASGDYRMGSIQITYSSPITELDIRSAASSETAADFIGFTATRFQDAQYRSRSSKSHNYPLLLFPKPLGQVNELRQS